MDCYVIGFYGFFCVDCDWFWVCGCCIVVVVFYFVGLCVIIDLFSCVVYFGV